MNKAFTLVELAIVIVIIGLLVGGVLTGQELINQAKIRAQIKQLQGYDSAALTFKAKYGYIPGDIPTTFALSIGLDSPSATAGNGKLDDSGGRTPPVTAQYEPWRFIQHLYLKGFVKARMTPSAISDYSIGVLFPEADIGKGGVCAVSLNDGIYYFLGPSEKNLGNQPNFLANSANPFLTPTEAFSIDQKLDDGIPSLGIVRAVIVTAVSATNFSNDANITLSGCLGATTQEYNLSASSNLCKIVIKSNAN